MKRRLPKLEKDLAASFQTKYQVSMEYGYHDKMSLTSTKKAYWVRQMINASNKEREHILAMFSAGSGAWTLGQQISNQGGLSVLRMGNWNIAWYSLVGHNLWARVYR